MSYEEFVSEFARRALEHPLWHHPWFHVIREKPTVTFLRRWAVEAGQIDEAFVELLGNLRHNAKVPQSLWGAIERNIADEQGGGNPVAEHFSLFRSVLGVLGVGEDTYQRRRSMSLPGTRALLLALRNAVRGGDSVRAVAMMASEEFICPREFPRLMTALREVLPASEPQWQPYFQVHCDCDPGHSADLLTGLYSMVCDDMHLMQYTFACQAEDLALNACFYDSLVVDSFL